MPVPSSLNFSYRAVGRAHPRRVRLDPPAHGGPAGRVVERRLEPGGHAGEERGAERGALGHGDGVDGEVGRVGHGGHPGRDPRATTTRDDAGRLDAAPVQHAPHDEAARLVGGPLERLGARTDVETVEVGTQRVVVEGRALAADVGQPDRDPAGIAQPRVELLAVGPRLRGAAQEPARPVDEQGAGVGRAPDQEPLGRGVRITDEARRHEPLVAHRPHDQRRAEDHQDVARLGRPGHDLVAQRVDGAAGDHGVAPGQGRRGLPHRHDGGHLLLARRRARRAGRRSSGRGCAGAPSDAVTPVSMAGTPERAYVATAWHGQ